jgi:CRISPR-associated protein Csd1
MCLDHNRKETSYRLGRLFAALEKTQQDSLGTLNASIRDRYYGSASATPRAVFPRLLRTYQHHLAKLEGGRKINREKLAQEILCPVSEFPAHLNLADQGLFALGYYHQMRAFYLKNDPSDVQPEN